MGDEITPDGGQIIMEIDATQFLDTTEQHTIQGQQVVLNIPIGSVILCAKALPDGTINIWVRRPIQESAPLCNVGVWVFADGQPMLKGDDITYLDTVSLLQAPSIVAPNARPRIAIFHVFLITATLAEGNVTLARG